MKKKGFTLIELLAVIVILAIIALIAVPVVMGIINTSRQKSAENSAYAYLKGLDFYIGVSELDLEPKKLENNQKYYLNKETIIDSKAIEQLNNLVEVNGSHPTGLDDYVELDSNYVVKKGILTIDGYTIEIENGKVKSSVKGEKINIVDFTLNVSETSIERGSTFEIKATFNPIDTTNQKLSYKSSDEGVVTVDSKGVVTGVSNGEATITVTSNDNNKISKQVKIKVVSPDAVTGVNIEKENSEEVLYVGKYINLIGKIEPEDAVSNSLTWESNNENIATVDSTGKVFGKSTGEVTITATSQSGISDSITIKVVEIFAESIEITGADTVEKGGTITLSTTISPSDTTNKTVTWTSSDEKIATIDENGVVTGIAPGTVTITAATAKVISDSITIKVLRSFADDDWETIIQVANDNNYQLYKVGDTKEIDMGSFGTHTLRIANTTPCDGSLESETACGFVLEFADIITKYIMNSTDTNIGGWPASEMRTYVNNDIYNALPDILKAGIIKTTVVSGHGSDDSSNFTSTDKLYLLSTAEVWAQGVSNKINFDTARDVTRQLDYYVSLGVHTFKKYSAAIKKYDGSTYNDSKYRWWLRSNYSSFKNYFYYVDDSGNWGVCTIIEPYGVSPAFRLAN